MADKTSFTLKRLKDAVYQGDKANYFIYDLKTPGLRLKITKTGIKTFQYYTWNSKKNAPITMTLGKFTGDNLDAARLQAQKYANDLTAGIDIEGEKNKARNEKTFDYYFQLFIKDQKALGKRDTVNLKSRYKNHVCPELGHKKISWFTEEKLSKWFYSLPDHDSKRGKKKSKISTTSANRCLNLVRRVFNQRCLKHIENPAKEIEPFKEYSRSRYLKPHELNKLLSNLENVSPVFADVFKMALFTGARKENLLSMRWQDIDLDSQTWTIKGEQSKNKEAMVIPLLPDAITLLKDRLHRQRKQSLISPFVFPGDGKKGYLADIKRQWEKLKKLSEIEDNLTFHDLRRSVGSYMAQSGQPLNLIGAVLGHRDLKTTLTYARLNSKSAAKSLEAGFSHMMEEAAKIKHLKG